MPKVSVIIPTYNRAHLVAESIQSVLDQTFTDFEIIVVDDGSTDNTKEVVDAFRDQRIRYTYQENQGVVVASNRGFELSRGEYIALFSSDDILTENALAKPVDVLDKHPEVAFSYGQVYLMDRRGHVFDLRKPRSGHSSIRHGIEEITKYLIWGNHITAATIMIRRDCLLEVGLFNPAFSSGSEDCDLWIRLAKKYDVAYIAEPVLKYRVHSANISSARGMDEELKSKSRILEGIFNDAELGPLFSPLRSRAYFRLHVRLALHAYSGRQMKTAREQLIEALKIHPGGLFQSMWFYLFIKTLLPLSVVRSIHRVNRYMRKVTWDIFLRLQTARK